MNLPRLLCRFRQQAILPAVISQTAGRNIVIWHESNAALTLRLAAAGRNCSVELHREGVALPPHRRTSSEDGDSRFHWEVLPTAQRETEKITLLRDGQRLMSTAAAVGAPDMEGPFQAPLTGYVEGFDQEGRFYGWIDHGSDVPQPLFLRCGGKHLALPAEIPRADVVAAGYPQGRGFLAEMPAMLDLLGEFTSGRALHVQNESGALLGQPVYWPLIANQRKSDLLWIWLAQYFAAQLEDHPPASVDLQMFDLEFSKLAEAGTAGLQDENGAARCVQMMQDLCARQAGISASFTDNLAKLCDLCTRLARSHPMWENARCGFATALAVEDLLATVRRNWQNSPLFGGTAPPHSKAMAVSSGAAIFPALYPARLHYLPWDGWVRKTLLGAVELADDLSGIAFDAAELNAKIDAVEAAASLLYRDEAIIAELQRLRRTLRLPVKERRAAAREALALKRQGKFLEALSVEQNIAADAPTAESLIAGFTSQLGAACELGQRLPLAHILQWKDRLAPHTARMAADALFLLSLHGYTEFLGRTLMNLANLGTSTSAGTRQARTEILGSINALLEIASPPDATRSKTRQGPPVHILLIGSKDLPQVHLYRQIQKVEALRRLSTKANPVCVTHLETWDEINNPKLTALLAGCDLLVVCRLPGTLPVLRLMHAARRAGVPVIYEIDDLIFDPENFPPPYATYARSITRREHRQLADDTVLWLEAMRSADQLVVSTATIGERARALLGPGQPIQTEPNCLPSLLMERTEGTAFAPRRLWRQTGTVRLVYGTGTKAHKKIIDEWILPVLQELVEKHPHLAITLVGRLQGLPAALLSHPRVKVIPFTDYGSYLDLLSEADISLAAVEDSPSTDAKSGLKWMEAAALGAASVVSPSATYREFLQDGHDVLFAATKEQWFEQLDRLVTDHELRTRLARNARRKALADFSPSHPEQIWSRLLSSTAPPPLPRDGAPRPLRLLLVNLYFWPQAEGGATRVVEDQIRELREKYPARYEITVLCTDRHDHSGGVDVYDWHGMRVVRFKARPKAWQAHLDSETTDFMDAWLARETFDVVHVHALQVLTASVLQSVRTARTPYVISLHDAWWLCQNQFLLSPQGQPVDPADWIDETGYLAPTAARESRTAALQHLRQLEKLLHALYRNSLNQNKCRASSLKPERMAAKLATLHQERAQIDRELDALVPDAGARLQVYSAYVRRQDLGGLLAGASARLAVSPSFARLYEDAGVDDVQVLGNSWQQYRPAPPRPDDGPLECAFIGGWSLHKGAGVLLEACRLLESADLRLRVVDHSLSRHESQRVHWGSVEVTFIAPVPLGEMETFYRSIDVLIAPSIWPESFGLVTREALSAGVWVIAADSGALAEPVQNGINGNVIAPRDVRALAESLRHAASAEGREALHRWREDALSSKGLATPPDNAETLHRIYTMAARIS